jgi:hypothetical protein
MRDKETLQQDVKTMRQVFCAVAVTVALLAGPAYAGWQNNLQNVITNTLTGPDRSSADSQTAQGLKQALEKGVDVAVKRLGVVGGYLDNPSVRIPLPEDAATAADALRLVGRGDMVDQFMESMNRAAEKAAPHAKDVFLDAITAMTFRDARRILTGPNNAATAYLDRTTRDTLFEKFLPIVKQMTDRYNVTSQYKALAASASGVGTMLGSKDPLLTDIDAYVTDKGLDGLFTIMAQEEKNIRENPAARTTELLKKVFGSN